MLTEPRTAGGCGYHGCAGQTDNWTKISPFRIGASRVTTFVDARGNIENHKWSNKKMQLSLFGVVCDSFVPMRQRVAGLARLQKPVWKKAGVFLHAPKTAVDIVPTLFGSLLK